MKVIAIKDMSCGNAETGDAWQETRIFNSSDKLLDVMIWVGERAKRITLTIPDNNAKEFQVAIDSKKKTDLPF